jgi:hypothetical protein
MAGELQHAQLFCGHVAEPVTGANGTQPPSKRISRYSAAAGLAEGTKRRVLRDERGSDVDVPGARE